MGDRIRIQTSRQYPSRAWTSARFVGCDAIGPDGARIGARSRPAPRAIAHPKALVLLFRAVQVRRPHPNRSSRCRDPKLTSLAGALRTSRARRCCRRATRSVFDASSRPSDQWCVVSAREWSVCAGFFPILAMSCVARKVSRTNTQNPSRAVCAPSGRLSGRAKLKGDRGRAETGCERACSDGLWHRAHRHSRRHSHRSLARRCPRVA